MQKISSYLYPNRINVVADVALFPVRWKIVYQNLIKIYQGVDNVLTLDIKNSDQKRIDISEMDLYLSITDIMGKEVSAYQAAPGATTGLATVTIPSTDLVNLDPQFLNFSLYRLNEDDTKTILYADTQFGAIGKMQLLGSAIPVEYPTREITTFMPLTDTDATPYETLWYSDAVEVKKPNHLGPESLESIDLDFYFNKSKAVVTVQFTTDVIINSGTRWVDVMAFGVFPEDTQATKTIAFPVYNRNITWMRVKVKQETYNGSGATVDIGKRASGLGFEATFLPNKPGKGYTIGESFTISADRFGGGGAWTLVVETVDGQGGVTQWLPMAEILVAEDGPVTYKDVPVSDITRARTIDKVVVRV